MGPRRSDLIVPSTDYLGVLQRYRVTVAAIVAVVVGIAGAVTFLEGPTYKATAEVLVVPNADATVAGAATGAQPADPVRRLGSEIQLLTGPVVRTVVESRLGPTPPISASAVSNADVIQITAASDRAGRAALIANAYASAYLDLRTASADATSIAASRPLQKKIVDLQAQIDGSTGQQRSGLIKTQAAFETELTKLQFDGAVNRAETRLLSAASPPASPSQPRPVLRVAWAVVVGFALGCAAGFYRDYRDDSVKSREELEAEWPDLPVQALIPVVAGESRRRREEAAVYEPQSPAGEAYQSLGHIIRSHHLDSGGSVLQITSPRGGEGKTTTVANVGVVLAQQGRRVAIVGCDLRRPEIQKVFAFGNETGLTSVITRQVALDKALRPVPDQSTLVVLPAGPVPPNPAELLATERASQILGSLKAEVDVVLLDCPPVLGVTDSVVVSAYADATVLVCRAGATTRNDLRQAIERLRLGGAPLAGIILTGIASEPKMSAGRRDGAALLATISDRSVRRLGVHGCRRGHGDACEFAAAH